MIANLIVVGSLVLTGAFVVAWILRPDLRNWVERPKHVFQSNLRRYDRDRSTDDNTVEEGRSI